MVNKVGSHTSLLEYKSWYANLGKLFTFPVLPLLHLQKAGNKYTYQPHRMAAKIKCGTMLGQCTLALSEFLLELFIIVVLRKAAIAINSRWALLKTLEYRVAAPVLHPRL